MELEVGSHNNLSNRFLHSLRFLVHFLKWVGIYIITPASIGDNKWLFIRRWLWSYLWLLLSIESHLYIFIYRGLKHIIKTIYSTDYKMMTEGFTMSLIRLADIFLEAPTHLFLLILVYRSTFSRIFECLEPVDLRLGRPNLISIKYYSIASLICIAWTVQLFCK